MEAFRQRLRNSCSFLPRVTFWYIGISTYSNDSISYKAYAAAIMVIAATYPINNFCVLLENKNDFRIIANCLFNCIGGISSFLKIIVLLINRKRLGKLLCKVEETLSYSVKDKSCTNQIYNMNKLTISWVGVLYTAVCVFSGGTLAGRLLKSNQDWVLPVSDVAFIDKTYSPNYELAWSYQVVAMSIVSTSFCLSDILIASVIVDISVQLRTLARRIRNLIKEIQHSHVLCNWNNLQSIVRIIVNEHNYITETTEKFGKIFNPLILLDVIGNISIVCFAAYSATVLPLFGFDAMQVYTEVLAVTSTLFFICYWGVEISLAGQVIAESCYSPVILGADLRLQKSMLLISLRSQRPVTFGVGKFATLSLTVFMWIIKNTYTLLMVLRRTKVN